MSNNIRDQLINIEEGPLDNFKDNARSIVTFIKNTSEKVTDSAKEYKKNNWDDVKNSAKTFNKFVKAAPGKIATAVKDYSKQRERVAELRKELQRKKRELAAQNKKEFKLTPTTKIVGGTALAAGLGLGAHYLYRKHKKNKKIRASMKKKM